MSQSQSEFSVPLFLHPGSKSGVAKKKVEIIHQIVGNFKTKIPQIRLWLEGMRPLRVLPYGCLKRWLSIVEENSVVANARGRSRGNDSGDFGSGHLENAMVRVLCFLARFLRGTCIQC